LKIAVGHYNNAVASLESRFIPQASKLYSLGSAYIKNEIADLSQIEVVPRVVESNDDLTEEEKITALLKPEQ
jgi:DNA recombination protein RmuC